MWRLLVFVVWAVLVALFAAENAQPVRLRFLVWQAPRVPEALVILLSVLLGVLLAAVAYLLRRLDAARARRSRTAAAEKVAPPPSGDSPPSS